MKLPAFARIPALVLLLMACSTGPVNVPPPTSTPAALTPSPLATATPTIGPTAAPTRAPQPPVTGLPPSGNLASEGSSVEGWLGSYCWRGTCADSAGPPPKASLPKVTVNEGQLELSLSDGATFVRWTISYGEDSGSSLETLDQGGEAFDQDAQPLPSLVELSSVQFASPAQGDWLLLAFVQFPGGDLSYAWHVVVP